MAVIGDAAHPMSMFKGQGANQALEDGPLLASWLSKCHEVCRRKRGKYGELEPKIVRECISTHLRCFEREMLSRTTPKVCLRLSLALHSTPEFSSRARCWPQEKPLSGYTLSQRYASVTASKAYLKPKRKLF